MIVLFLLPLLFSLVHAECFDKTVYFKNIWKPYEGQVMINLWDDNYWLFGGDEKILTINAVVSNFTAIRIRDDRTDCGYFYYPYVEVFSNCKPRSGAAFVNVPVEWKDEFNNVFDKEQPIYRQCRRVISKIREDRKFDKGAIQLATWSNENEC